MKGKAIVLIILSAFALCGTAWALGEEKKPIIVDGDKVEFFNKEKKVIGSGSVVITYEDMRLTCDRAVVYMDTHDAYAEGRVSFYQGDTIFRGEKLNINFDTKKGTVLKSRFETPEWYGGGPRAEKVADKEYDLTDGYITSCGLIKPHYRIQGRRVYLYLDDKVVLKNAFFYLGDQPVMYLPSYTHPLDDDRPRVTVIPGRSKDWGEFVLTSWRYYLSENNQGRVQLDERTKRNSAVGLTHNYKSKNFGEGKLKLYYMDERRLDEDFYKKKRVLEVERERFTVDLRHRWQVDKETLALAEFHRVKYKDDTFLKDYFYRDRYENEPAAESYLQLTTSKPEYTMNLLVKKRVNRHESVTETLPELKVDFSESEIGKSNIYYFGNITAANYNQKPTAPTDEDTDANVLDTYNKVSYKMRMPWIFNFIHFTPFVATQQTYYSKDKIGADRNFIRGIYSGGFELLTKFYRIFDIHSNLWGLDINRLRHIITPRVSYNYVHSPTVSSDQVGFLGANQSNSYTFDLENKLQTKHRRGDGSFDIVDIARLDTNVNFIPNTKGERWSDISATLELRPYKWLTVAADTNYNNYTRDFNSFNLDLKAVKGGFRLGAVNDDEKDGDNYVENWDRWEFGIGHRYTRNSSTELTMETAFPIGWKWRFRIFERIFFKKFKQDNTKAINEINEQEYTISKDLHCWTMDLTYSNTRGFGEAFWLVFRLKAFPEMPFEFESAYHQRKFGSQSWEKQ